MTQPLRLDLVVIARDEAPRIERLLRSVAPWVDAMWLLDTGSTDATPALAAACGAQVRHLPWPHDFSAARNAALDLSDADWHLVLDADEWLIDGGPALAALRHTEPGFVGAVHFHDRFIAPAADPTATPQAVNGWLSRVLPGRLRYEGRIHEQVVHTLPVRRLAVRIGHDGYLPERLQAKRGRNRPLLEAALAAAPDDAYLWFQLGKDCSVYAEHAAAETAYARALQFGGASQVWGHELVVRRLHGLKALQRHAEGMDFADRQLQACIDVPDFFFTLGDLLLDLAAGQPARGAELLPLIEAAWTRCLEIGERPDLSGCVAGRGSHLAAHNLALLLDLTGRTAEAQALRQAHGGAASHPVAR